MRHAMFAVPTSRAVATKILRASDATSKCVFHFVFEVTFVTQLVGHSQSFSLVINENFSKIYSHLSLAMASPVVTNRIDGFFSDPEFSSGSDHHWFLFKFPFVFINCNR